MMGYRILMANWAIAVSWISLAPSRAAELVVEPSSIELLDPFSNQQIIVREGTRDVTQRATFAVQGSAVRLLDHGYVVPLADGEAKISVTHNGTAREVTVKVSGFATPRQIDFRNEIVPILSRYGCNAGGCHGKASGQNGFKLSLFGFDVAHDYEQIVKQGHGRRVFPAAAERSLLLQKAVNQMPHGGGKRFDVGSDPYNLIKAWIAQGLPVSAQPIAVQQLKVWPTERVFEPHESQQLAVIATYSDGSQRDVTRQASYSSNLEIVARVTENGLVIAGEQSGEAAIMAQFMGQVVVFTAGIPHGSPLAEIPNFAPQNYVDTLSLTKWKQFGIMPSPVCDDATFLRRVTLDVAGRLPTPEEVRQFLAEEAPDKRAKLIDRLLDSADYPAFFAMRWGTILRNSQLAGATQASYAFHNWLKDSIARNQPYDEFVRGIVAAAGEWQDAPAINWLWQNRDDQLHQTTADVAQVFLGTRLQCARCHHHPFERFSQEDYYGLAGFFTRLGRKSFGEPPPYFSAPTATTNEKNPLTQKAPEPKFLDGEYAKFTSEQDPRQALVDWMAQPENPFFAKALVNRLWGHFFGRGIVHEVDDLRQTNPPSNPALLDALAKDFVEHKFDVKHLIRTMLNSRVYQLSSEPNDRNRQDRQYFARFYARRLVAEVLHDAVDQATGHKSKFSGMAAGAKAIDLPHEGFGSYFLDTFDRPKRVTTCECERSAGATLSQVLLLSNSDEIENKISSGEAKIAKALAAKQSPEQIIEELYLSAFSRLPNKRELAATHSFLHNAGPNESKKALEDILWTLLNSKEFMFNH
jgi:hypothetical protein